LITVNSLALARMSNRRQAAMIATMNSVNPAPANVNDQSARNAIVNQRLNYTISDGTITIGAPSPDVNGR
jgi:hypothetical protein